MELLAIAAEMHDLAVKYGVPAVEHRGDGGRQLGEGLEEVFVPRREPGARPSST